MTRMLIFSTVTILIPMVFSPIVVGQTRGTTSYLESQQALTEQYCSGCHNDIELAGNMSLSQLNLMQPHQTAELAEAIIRKLRAGLMPPAGSPRPETKELNAFSAFLEQALDKRATKQPYIDVPELHRVNRTEYRNAIRDLLDLDVNVSELLPRDAITGGFDNMADALSVTPALMQGYIRAAEKIARLAVGDARAPTAMVSYSVPRVENQLNHVEGTPFGTRGGSAIVHNFPADGEYTFKIDLYHYYTGSLIGYRLPDNLENQQIDVSVDGSRVALLDIDPALQDFDGGLHTGPIKIKAGPRRIAVAFLSKFEGPVEDRYWLVDQTLVDVSIANHPGLSSLPHLKTFAITGPINPTGISETPSRRNIFTCQPDPLIEETCAMDIISRLARSAFRRPVDADDMESLMGFYRQGYREGNFEVGIRMALQAILAKPEFVFRFERLPQGIRPGETFQISDLELASRLSFFLWSSPPDDELLSIAQKGQLSNSSELRRQVRRMLNDPRSKSLTSNFAAQWLRLKGIEEVHPEGLSFPNFTRTLARAMRNEISLFFDSIIREDRNVFELLTANYTFVNQTLAEHYGIANVNGSQFERVQLNDPNRSGLIGKAGWLTMTSLPNRTSPVQRGKYVLEVLLGTPPPNPPAVVPPLKEAARNEKVLSVRERIEKHRSNPACSACHQIMDPIGLALENFSPVGRWRTVDAGSKIDASSTMYDGTALKGPQGVSDAVLGHPEAFIRNFAEKLFAYGLGRVLDYRDMPTVRSISRTAAESDNKFSSFVLAIVETPAFQMSKRPQSEE